MNKGEKVELKAIREEFQKLKLEADLTVEDLDVKIITAMKKLAPLERDMDRLITKFNQAMEKIDPDWVDIEFISICEPESIGDYGGDDALEAMGSFEP